MGVKKQCCKKLGKKDFPSPTMEMLYDILVASSQEYCNQGRRRGANIFWPHLNVVSMAFLLNPGNKFNILLLKGQAHNFLDYNLFGFEVWDGELY